MKYTTTIGERTFEIEINSDSQVVIDGEIAEIDFALIGDSNLCSLIIDNESFEAVIEERDGLWYVLLRGDLYSAEVADERTQRLARRTGSNTVDSGELTITAPMPGRVVAVPVEPGQQVEEGQTVIILESMKMENELKTPRAGVIERIAVEVGESVEQRQTLVVIT